MYKASASPLLDVRFISTGLPQILRDKSGKYIKGTQNLKGTHGMSKTRFYKTFHGIKFRCEKENATSWDRYGGRGIKCLWDSFESFKEDMYKSYQSHVEEHGIKNTTIERIDSTGHYSKENCKWATYNEQNLNKKNVHRITFRGKTMSIAEWAREINVPYFTLYTRFHEKWPVEKALTYKRY